MIGDHWLSTLYIDGQGVAGQLVYSLVAAGSSPGTAVEYFYISPTTAELSARRRLTFDLHITKYMVCL